MIAAVAERVAVAGPVGEKDEGRKRRHGLGQVLDELLGRLVDPVKVLHHEHEGAALRRALEARAERAEGLAAARRGVHLFGVGVADREREHVPEEGKRPRQRTSLLRLGLGQLREGRRLVVAVADAEAAPQSVGDGMEGGAARVGGAAPLDPAVWGGLQAAAELEEQPRFPEAGLAHHEHHPAAPRARRGEGFVELGELALAPHEGREPRRRARFDAVARSPCPQHLEAVHLPRDAFQVERAPVAELEVARHQVLGRLGDQDAVGERSLLQAGGEVGRVAHRRVVHAQVVADPADDDRARVDRDAHAELDARACAQLPGQLGHGALDAEGGVHGAARRVLQRERCAEEGHGAVAEELVDGALVGVHVLADQLDEAVHDRVHLLRAQVRGERRRVHDVAEQHGHVLALALERRARAQDALGEVARRVGARIGRGAQRGVRGEAPTAAAAERGAGRVRPSAGHAGRLERGSAPVAVVRAGRILALAGRADHGRPRSDGARVYVFAPAQGRARAPGPRRARAGEADPTSRSRARSAPAPRVLRAALRELEALGPAAAPEPHQRLAREPAAGGVIGRQRLEAAVLEGDARAPLGSS